MNSAKQKKSSDCKKSKNPIDYSQMVGNNDSLWKIWPIERNKYQKMAYDAYKSNDMDKATLYDCMTLSCGFVGGILNIDRLGQTVNQKTISKTIHLQQNTGNKLFDYLSAKINNISLNETVSEPTNVDDQSRFNELCDKCAQLPREWNVVQLSQMYDEYNSYATKKDMYTSNAPIKITLFRDSLPDTLNNRPISIVLDLFEIDEESIFSTAYEINQVLYKNYVANMGGPNYGSFSKKLTDMQKKLIDDMSSWLGPWISLFSGKIKGANGEDFEQKIFEQVDQFCSVHNNLSKYQCMLLSLLARRIDLIDTKEIKQGAQDIAYTNDEYNRIVTFLTNLKKNTDFQDFEYYPCILVIDEILDQMPWEMVLKSQQFTRVHSIQLLFDLYARFKDQIDDGYLKMKMNNGFALVNPDNDTKLGDMSKRLSKYYETCFPQWNFIEGVVPTIDKISDGLAKSELFVYSGHGSSLQFFSSIEFEKMKYNCIMMLFGCESLAMKPQGTICEATCSAYTYFKCGCPGILGALTIVTDVWIDVVTICLLTQWAASKQIKHPDIQQCKDDATKKRVNKILKKFAGKRNPNLLELIGNIRDETDINIRIRSAIVYRGLPPYNTACSK